MDDSTIIIESSSETIELSSSFSFEKSQENTKAPQDDAEVTETPNVEEKSSNKNEEEEGEKQGEKEGHTK